MYVDNTLSGELAVQTLSRLNRAHPAKHDAFVLDFANDAIEIQRAFELYYRTTVLADETDAYKLHALVNDGTAARIGDRLTGPTRAADSWSLAGTDCSWIPGSRRRTHR